MRERGRDGEMEGERWRDRGREMEGWRWRDREMERDGESRAQRKHPEFVYLGFEDKVMIGFRINIS